ncbi:MAG: hypothetical protein J7M21_00515 [Planctomycetes bacterium]|nr:hypothetical protein [Planctomycetota bacterium]
MPVKRWSFAGLILTYRCTARCASCYLCCSPDAPGRMAPGEAVEYWRQLDEALGRPCRIHLTGGEPFIDWPGLIETCRLARAAGLGPLQKVETNAFWATGASVVRERIRALDEAGMEKLVISADPYHQQFVPIERCRLAARLAEEVLGPHRVQVRWRDWLAEGFDTAGMDQARLAGVFAGYAASGRDRLNGRAAETLAPLLASRPTASFADDNCRGALLRSRHVHIGPDGLVMPGTCAGIALGSARDERIDEIHRRLERDYASRPVVAALAARGPVGLAELAGRFGYEPPAACASKCQLCWSVRRWLAGRGLFADELQPAWMYRSADCAAG